MNSVSSAIVTCVVVVISELVGGVRVGHHRRGAWADHGHAGRRQRPPAHRQRPARGQQPAQADRQPLVHAQAQSQPAGLSHRVLVVWVRHRGESVHWGKTILPAQGKHHPHTTLLSTIVNTTLIPHCYPP